jgi:diguanylate cyclase (GGDEF)-like protein
VGARASAPAERAVEVVEERSYGRLAALAHAGHRLAAVASLDEAVDVVATNSLDLIAGDSASVGRIDASTGLIRILCNVGKLADWEEERPDDEHYPLADFPQLSLPPERATAWYGYLEDPRLRVPERRLITALGKRAMLVVPLVVDRTVWGMVSVARGHDHGAFDAEDLAAGEALGGMVGAALARMEERSELHALAYRDALTGLANRRAVDDLLEEVFARETLSVRIAVVLCDVNGLKGVNDVHGHDVGDALLREVARLLSTEAGLHPEALAARLGGDEFCLVLQDVDDAELEAMTARLSEQARAIGVGDGLACGFAVADKRPGDATTSRSAAKAILRLADAAQYRVKRTGDQARSRTPWSDPQEAARTIGAEMVERALGRLDVVGTQLVDRLEAVALAISEATDAGAWAVSRSEDGGPVVIVSNVDRVRGHGDEPPQHAPGVAFDLDDYPATRAALEGGSFHATLASGEDSEREFLAACGYAEMIAAGRTVGTDGWLIEVFGDALSVPMVGLTPLLRVLLELAVAGADLRPSYDDDDRASRSVNVGSSA